MTESPSKCTSGYPVIRPERWQPAEPAVGAWLGAACLGGCGPAPPPQVISCAVSARSRGSDRAVTPASVGRSK